MKSALFTVTLAAAAAGAAAHNYNVSTIWTTEVVDVYTTFCPLATTIVHGNQTYTATDSHTLIITNCPCTVSKPVTMIASVECHSCLHPTAPNTLVPSPSKNATWLPSQPSSVPVPHPRILVPVPNVHTTSAQLPVGTTPSTLTPAQPTAGASRVFAVSGAALVGLAGLVAFAL